MQTLKIKYISNNMDAVKNYCRQYCVCLHFMYNRLSDNSNLTQKELRQLSSNINNIKLLDSHFINSCVQNVVQISKGNDKVIFGGKYNFIKRIKGLITKEEYQNNRFNQIYSIGEAPQKGNRKFRIEQDCNSIIFQPSKYEHIKLNITDKRKYILSKLYQLQERKGIAITYKLTDTHINISFDESKLAEVETKKIKNRILGIDLNPNYIGYSICDWKDEDKFDVIKSGVYSLKELNDNDTNSHLNSTERIYFSNKRKHELIEICKDIVNTAIHFECETISIEKLNIKTTDKGKQLNKLCNNYWVRNLIINNIQKRCNLYHIKLQQVVPNYSSFVGNILYRSLKLPDMCLSAIEMTRRAYEFITQYITKEKQQIKNIVFPQLKDRFELLYIKSLEEFNYNGLIDWLSLYKKIKDSKLRYRVSLIEKELYRKFSIKSNIVYYTF